MKKNKIKQKIKNSKLYKYVKKQISKINFEKNKFNTLELMLIFIMALLLGVLLGEMIFSGGTETVSITKKLNKNIAEIENVYNTVLEEYINEVDGEELKDAAITGMMDLLGDNYSVYFNEEESNSLKEELEGSFYGMGVEIYRNEKGKIIVNKVFEGSPAEKAGIKAEDEYLKINGKDITEKTTSEISSMIKGTNQKTFTITVKRDGKEIDTKVTTAKIEIPSVESEIIETQNEKIGYIYIKVFANNTDEQFEKHLKEIENKNIDKLIIDVRSNVGGELETVINVASNFLKKDDVIVQTVSNEKKSKRYSVKNSTNKYDIVVLIDEGSASGSEVLASALNENVNAELVGQTTFGKGTVQKVKTLPSGSMIKYTIETWQTSKGKEIDKVGIKPTVEIKMNEEYYETLEKEKDNQLQKAIDILSKK